ncbi:MAG TPA: tetratricopeptide repeat protein [Dongiaceae bacterium]|nr:tetratricopeptide repeat protein [Dongiaceae bacterium]
MSRLFSGPSLALAVSLLAITLTGCSSSPPPTMADVKKLVAEDRTFDALQTLIPMAQAGDPAAQYELAGFYHYGYVGAADFTKAMKWYRASARQGYADAMVGLSVMYLGGQGVAKDPREAFVWLNLAAQYMTDKQALEKIKHIRDEIGRGFTKDDIAYAKAESLLLQPETSSVQPNEAESIDHLPDQLPAETTTTAPTGTEPLQNVPPETAPLSDIPLQNALPAAPTKPLTMPSTALPSSTAATTAAPAAGGLPATTATQPTSVLPATTAPATTAPATTAPLAPQATTEAAPSNSDSDTGAPPSATQVEPIPKF